MKVLLISSNDAVGLSIYRQMQRKDVNVIWYAGVFNDLTRHLKEGRVYLYRVIPDHIDELRPEKVDLSEVDVAFIEESLHGARVDGLPDHSLSGVYKGWDIVDTLTACGIVCIGFSSRQDCLTELLNAGAVAAVEKDQLVKNLRPLLAEAERLVTENSPDSPGMKALSLYQPWAWATMVAGKDVDNRKWPAKIRGTIAIHAVDNPSLEAYAAASRFIEEAARQSGKRFLQMPLPGKMPKDAIIGVVDIVEVTTSSASPWFEGPLGMVLANPRPLPEPIPCPGQRRFFTLPRGVERRIRSMLKGAL